MEKNKHATKALYFDLDNPEQRLTFEFLKKCGKKQSRYIGIIVDSFVKMYGIDVERTTPQEMKTFFEVYDVIKNINFEQNAASKVAVQKILSSTNSKEDRTKDYKQARDGIKKNMSF